MKFSISRDDLEKSINIVKNAVAAKSTLPVLSNILLEVKGKKIKLAATDLDIGIIKTIESQTIESEGALTIPIKQFSEIIKIFPGDEVLLNAKKNNTITLEAKTPKKASFKIPGIPKEEFPKLPEPHHAQNSFMIPQKTLKQLFTKTYFATSKDETRYVLNGILFEVEKGIFRLVATDGRRLALAKTKLGKEPSPLQFIIPNKTVNELIRILADTDEEVQVSRTENQIFFTIRDVVIISRIIEGEFPNYKQVIPEESKDKLPIVRQELIDAIKRAMVFSTQDSIAVKLDIFKNKLVISKNSPDTGEAKEELDIAYAGKEMTVGFNPNFLIDILRNLTSEVVQFELSAHDKPAVVREKDETDYLYIVLPMQL